MTGFLSPSPHLEVPLRRRGPGRPWSTGRCHCSWRPRRTAPPVLPAPPTGPRAPGRSECTRLQQRDREGKSILSSFHCDLAVSCHLLLHCIELHSPSSVLSTSACPYGGCWADLLRVFIVYSLFFSFLFYYVFFIVSVFEYKPLSVSEISLTGQFGFEWNWMRLCAYALAEWRDTGELADFSFRESF